MFEMPRSNAFRDVPAAAESWDLVGSLLTLSSLLIYIELFPRMLLRRHERNHGVLQCSQPTKAPVRYHEIIIIPTVALTAATSVSTFKRFCVGVMAPGASGYRFINMLSAST